MEFRKREHLTNLTVKSPDIKKHPKRGNVWEKKTLCHPIVKE
jgi:hypothetical protein